jgi:hypothetical protein
LVAIGTGVSLGQSVNSGHGHHGHHHFHGHGGFYGGYRASTVAEGYARGLADVIRAQGESNLSNALAQREWEAARKEQYENKILKVKTFYERRAIYDYEHAAEVAARRAKAEARIARIRLTDFSAEEFNPATGVITWPTLLADEAFADYSAWFDSLLSERAKYGRLSAGELGEAEAIIKQWRAELVGVKDQVPAALLRDNLRFLLRLDRELKTKLG